MNKIILFGVFIIVIILMSYRSEQKKKKIIFFGDSITELGVKPKGYVTLVREMITAEAKDGSVEVMGSGISGNKVYDLYLRADEDVIAKRPDIVVIYIGVNDVWHRSLLGTGTDFDKFGRFYEALVNKLQQNNIKVILATPAVVGEHTDNTNELDGDLNRFSKWIQQFAKRKALHLVDLRNIFIQYNIIHNTDNKASGILTYDRVHLNDKGNEVVAKEMWRVLKEVLNEK